MLRGMVAPPLPDVVAAVLAGRDYRGLEHRRPEDGEQALVVPAVVLRDLVLGHYGPLPRPVISLVGVLIDGDLDLSYCDWHGNLSLLRCRIRGSVNLAHARVRGRVSLSGSSVRRIDVSNATIDGPLLFVGGMATEGLFGLALTTTGSLNLGQATVVAPVDKPNSCAVELYRAKLGDLFLGDATLRGGLYGNGMTVERNVRLQGLQACSRRSLGLEAAGDTADGQSVSLTGARIGGAIYCRWAEPDRQPMRLEGGLFLTRASCASLHVRARDLDGVDVWLDGFTFGRLLMIAPEEWLALIERASPESNQPYVFYAAHCEAYGMTRLRRAVLVAMHDRTREGLRRWSVDRALWSAWRVVVRYGYSSAWAIGWLVVAVALCAAVLALAGGFLVHDPVGSAPAARGIHETGDIVAFALDSVLPFAGLHAADAWSARPDGAGQIVTMVVFVIVKLAGWGLAALGLASVTGIAKRE